MRTFLLSQTSDIVFICFGFDVNSIFLKRSGRRKIQLYILNEDNRYHSVSSFQALLSQMFYYDLRLHTVKTDDKEAFPWCWKITAVLNKPAFCSIHAVRFTALLGRCQRDNKDKRGLKEAGNNMCTSLSKWPAAVSPPPLSSRGNALRILPKPAIASISVRADSSTQEACPPSFAIIWLDKACHVR